MSRSAWSWWIAFGPIAGAAVARPALQVDALAGATADVRVEHFVLETQPGGELASGPARAIGVAAWRRRLFSDATQLECETTFFSGSSGGGEAGERRILHVEHLSAEGTRLVWRELGAGSGRSLLAEWTPDGGGLRTVDWSGDECVREVIDTHAGAVMPLYLIELVREGRAIAGHHLRFDPLARALEAVEIRTSYDAGDPTLACAGAGSAPELRMVELARGDGTLAARCRFRGTELVAFQWQEGSLTARRIDAIEYAKLLGHEDVEDARDP